jgi:amino acid transporter
VPAILVVLGRIILACFGLGLLLWLAVTFIDVLQEARPTSRTEWRDYPLAVIGVLGITVILAIAVAMIVAAFLA